MSQIKTNTTALQDLLDAASNLPKPIDTSDATATSSKILSGYTAYVKDKMIAGSMANNGAVSKTLDGVATKSVTIPAGYTSGGTVSMDGTVDNAVTAALSALVEKGVEVPDGTNVTGLAALISGIEAGGINLKTCAVNIYCSFGVKRIGYTTIDENGQLSAAMQYYTYDATNVIVNCVCGTCLFFLTGSYSNVLTMDYDGVKILASGDLFILEVNDTNVATINIRMSGNGSND